MTDPLYDDPRLAAFYDAANDLDGADYATATAFAHEGRSLLDLGCGTGRFAAACADAGLRAIGVDPAEAMLAIARTRPGGARVDWFSGDARTLRLGRRFDRITMLGHAFQTLLSCDDRRAALATMAARLSPDGRILLDSRNPLAREWEEWTPERSRFRFDAPGVGPVEGWNDVAVDAATGIVTYATFYRLPDGDILSARSRIAFPPREELEALLDEVGLVAHSWWGHWDRRPWTPDAPEIVLVAARA